MNDEDTSGSDMGDQMFDETKLSSKIGQPSQFSKAMGYSQQEESLKQATPSLRDSDPFLTSTKSLIDDESGFINFEDQTDNVSQSNSSWVSSVINSMASIFGAGYVGIPYALSLAGLPLGIVLMIVMAIISGKMRF